ncbi:MULTISPECIES: hypothetical protein [unclassified Aurantimonas]|uniref:hypothetical protein n=1 Tax=unclassified Aurantimonas TaxID=2638230 RepID=UPI002E177A45|nr:MULTISPECIES: hypothetical protein [unclassified Aurantimonas]MEC5289416.1 hypothetical protein [Aurantimonas sp. C2-3-R2]MEC5410496.1 hypothetical protein [Aurantimonas sp. C2-4-R8]
MTKAASNDTSQSAENDRAIIGSNGDMTSDQRQALGRLHLRAYKKAMAAKKLTDAEVKNVCKVLKSDLGDNGLDQVKTMIAMETPEGEEKVKAKLQAQREAIAWSADPDGQLDMFSGANPTDTPAFHSGKIAGMDDEPCKSPFVSGTSDDDDWIRGWQLGNSVMNELIKTRTEAAELIKGSDDEDLDDEQDAA